jgi:hypothetical protein
LHRQARLHGNFICQKLAYAAFNTLSITTLNADLFLGAMGFNLYRCASRMASVEVFFCKPYSEMTRSTLRVEIG